MIDLVLYSFFLMCVKILKHITWMKEMIDLSIVYNI